MTNKELTAALRCCRINDCENCPARSTAIRTSAPHCDEVLLSVSADALENSEPHVAALQQEIKKLRGMVPRWIPVEECRPAYQQPVLVVSEDGAVHYATDNVDWPDGSVSFCAPATDTYLRGAYWMPLPEGPKEATA